MPSVTLLTPEELKAARASSEIERQRRGYHVCQSCGRMSKPCYRHAGAVLCARCMSEVEWAMAHSVPK